MRQELWCAGAVSFIENRGERGAGNKGFSCKGPFLPWRVSLEAWGRAQHQQYRLCPPHSAWAACRADGSVGSWCGPVRHPQPGATGCTPFRRMWLDLVMTLDYRNALVFPTDCIPQVNNVHKHMICFNMESAQMKCKAGTILSCLCFKTLCLEWCLICIWEICSFFCSGLFPLIFLSRNSSGFPLRSIK